MDFLGTAGQCHLYNMNINNIIFIIYFPLCDCCTSFHCKEVFNNSSDSINILIIIIITIINSVNTIRGLEETHNFTLIKAIPSLTYHF